MSIQQVIEDVLAERRRDAEIAALCAQRIEAFALGASPAPPAQEELLAFQRATGARESGRDLPSRILRAVRARLALAQNRPVAATDLAAAARCSRQWISRQFGSLVPAPVALRILRERDADA